jgi:MFS family permease
MITSRVLRQTKSSFLPQLSVLIAALVYCADVLLRVSPGVLADQLIAHYQINQTAFSNLSAAYFYVYAPMQLPVGILMDRYGPRHLLFVSALCCALGAALFTATHIYSVAFIARLLIGFGSSFAFVGIMKLATLTLPANRFALVSGSTMALGMIGGLIGDQVLKHFLVSGAWQQFMTNIACFMAVIGLLIFATAPNLEKSKTVRTQGERSIGTVLKEIWLMFKNKELIRAALIACLMYTPLTWFAEYLGKSYLALSLNMGFEHATDLNDLIFIGWAIGGLTVTSFSDRIQSRRIPIIVGALVSFVLSLLILYQTGLPYMALCALMVIFGIANSVQVLAFPVAKELSKTHLQATAMCFINMICMLSGNLQVVLGMLLDYVHSFTSVGATAMTLIDYQIVFFLLPMALLLAAFIAYRMKETFPVSE